MTSLQRPSSTFGRLFRVALFAAAASLAMYIPYKYATQLHAVEGFYALLFPLSALLAVVGMVVAVKPARARDCGVPMRSGVAALSVLWLATGLMCVGTLTAAVVEHPLHGSIAAFHMLAQHVFLSLALIAFALAPQRVARALGVATPAARPQPIPGTAVV
jgi:hypothetical protein